MTFNLLSTHTGTHAVCVCVCVCVRAPQTVVVQVFPVKDQVPEEGVGAVRALRVRETEVVLLTRAQLSFRDPERPHADLSYRLSEGPSSPARPGYRGGQGGEEREDGEFRWG